MNEKVKQALDNIALGSNTLESQTKQFQEDYNLVVNALSEYEEEKKELIAKQHRLFDLTKEQEEALKIIIEKRVDMSLFRDYDLDIYSYNTDYVEDEFRLTQREFDLVKKVVENYGTK